MPVRTEIARYSTTSMLPRGAGDASESVVPILSKLEKYCEPQ